MGSIDKKIRCLLAAFCGFLVLGSTAMATTTSLPMGNSWTEFRFDIATNGGQFVEATGDAPDVLSFEIALTSSALLQVTDAYRAGDQFALTATNTATGTVVPLGATSVPTLIGEVLAADGLDFGNNYDAAFLDPRFSSGSFLLTQGTYLVSGVVLQQPEKRGRAALRLIAPVPLPASLGMLGGAVVLLGVFGFTRKKTLQKEHSA